MIHNASKKSKVPFNVLLQVYFFERFLYRLANSDYKDWFILKGGFFLSSILGITERSTIDIDFSVFNIPFNESSLKEIIHTIIRTDLGDNVSYEVNGITVIMAQNEYNGYQFSMIGKLENIKVPFNIDIATETP